ncbi:hypothetical protein KY385_03255 [Candidatus Parcubacteria bacterium]|nr:hypothetical protein [Candidatus Parcubacteria bacterium]
MQKPEILSILPEAQGGHADVRADPTTDRRLLTEQALYDRLGERSPWLREADDPGPMATSQPDTLTEKRLVAEEAAQDLTQRLY